MHGRQVPDVADNGPGGHHEEDVVQHAVLGAVPESFSKLDVVLYSHRPDGPTDLEGSLLELHDAGVVDAGPLGEYEDGQLVRVLHVLLQPPEHGRPVLGLAPVEPDLSRGLGESGLEVAQEPAVFLARLQE